MAIRRAKERVNLINDGRIKVCTQRFDSRASTTAIFVVGSDSLLNADNQSESEDDDTDADCTVLYDVNE